LLFSTIIFTNVLHTVNDKGLLHFYAILYRGIYYTHFAVLLLFLLFLIYAAYIRSMTRSLLSGFIARMTLFLSENSIIYLHKYILEYI
jgi:hypothetical protein